MPRRLASPLALEDRLTPAAGFILDINTVPDPGSSTPALLSHFPGDRVLFKAGDKTHGTELWLSDGTAAGTDLFTDGTPGFDSLTEPRGLVTSGGLGFFTADSPTRLRSLWRTDGTTAGTFPLDISPTFDALLDPVEFVPYPGGLYFVASTSGATNEIWKSDGTPGGTVQVTAFPSLDGRPYNLTMVGNTLYFGFSGPGTTEDLWKTTGTGATLVRAGFTAQPINLTAAGDALYFTGTDAAGGAEVWKADGGGAVRVADVRPGSTGSSPANFRASGGKVYFTADDGTTGVELWATDGTPAGTYQVSNIATGANSANPSLLTDWNGTLYFAVQSGIFSPQLWKSDGTGGGTTLVHNFNVAFGAHIRAIAPVHGSLYVAASDGTAGTYLWRSDGATTTLVKDVGVTFTTDAKAAFFPIAGGFLFVGNEAATGTELWFSDGTTAGTRLVEDIWSGTRDVVLEAGSAGPTAVGNRLFFNVQNPATGKLDLWRSDGTAPTTGLVRAFQYPVTAVGPDNLADVNGTLFFSATDTAAGTGLWMSDGTPGGTTLVKAMAVTPGASPVDLTPVGGTLFFRGYDAATGYQVYRSDGTAAGTGIVRTINGTAFSGADPSQLTAANGLLYFVANDGTSGFELWRTDGTEAGTILVSDLRPGSTGSSPGQLTPVGGLLYFTATDATGAGLWKTDGTPAGTVLVSRDAGTQMTAAGGKVFYVRGTGGADLWVSDGTAAGTHLVPNGAGVGPQEMTAAGNRVYFRSRVISGFGQEPWVSDGTAAGTFRLRDIAPGAEHSTPREFRAFGNDVYFIASNRLSGRELWRTDGTAAGTALADDLVPGSGDGRPEQLTVAGNRLFFTAVDEAHGRELWAFKEAPVAQSDAYPAVEDGPLDVPAPGVLANDGLGGSGLTAVLIAGPSHGTLVLNPDGSFTYTPAANYSGPDAFTYRANDGTDDSNETTVALTVSPVNDRPVAAPDSYSVAEDGVLNVPAAGVLANDDDIEGDPLTAVLTSGPAHGSLALNADGSFTYTPVANYFGPDSFTYSANDPLLASDPVTVALTVTPVNDAPVATGEGYSMAEDGTLTVPTPGLTANDTDIETDPLTVVPGAAPAHGTLTLNADGSFTYTPAANYFGPDSFTYSVTDGAAGSNAVTVNLTVTAVNDAPVAVDDSAIAVLKKPVTIRVLTNDTDGDGDTLSVVSFTQPANGTLRRQGNTFVYTAAGVLGGSDTFTYTVADGQGGTATATVYLTLVDPVAPRVADVRVRYGPAGRGVFSVAGVGRAVLPGAGVAGIEIAFTEDVTLTGLPATLTGPAGPVPLTMSAGTRSAVWDFAALPIGRYTLRLSGAGVRDANGNPVARDYVRTFAVLPGDFDGNGFVNAKDVSAIRKKFQTNPAKVNPMADVTGDGIVNQADVDAAAANLGRRL